MKKILKKVFKIFLLLLGLLLVCIFYPIVWFVLSAEDTNGTVGNVQIIGHRGAAGYAPENTIASFQKAMDLGVDFIELDIHQTADDELVVIHDNNVQRTTNGNGTIENLSLKEIKTLDAGSWFGTEFENEKVPTLDEVLVLTKNKCKLLIEIKWPEQGIYEKLVPKLVSTLEKHGAMTSSTIQSFETSYLKEIIALKKNLACHQLIIGSAAILPFYYERGPKFGYFKPLKGITSVNQQFYFLNATGIQDNADQKIASGAYTLNHTKTIQKAVSWGLEFVITDYPDIAIRAVR